MREIAINDNGDGDVGTGRVTDVSARPARRPRQVRRGERGDAPWQLAEARDLLAAACQEGRAKDRRAMALNAARRLIDFLAEPARAAVGREGDQVEDWDFDSREGSTDADPGDEAGGE